MSIRPVPNYPKIVPSIYPKLEPSIYPKIEKKESFLKDLLDPVTFEIMRNPLLDPISGRSYEREVILNHLKSKEEDPITGKPLKATQLIPNHDLLAKIVKWRHQNSNLSQEELQKALEEAKEEKKKSIEEEKVSACYKKFPVGQEKFKPSCPSNSELGISKEIKDNKKSSFPQLSHYFNNFTAFRYKQNEQIDENIQKIIDENDLNILSGEELVRRFKLALEQNWLGMIKAIVACREFKNIPSGEKGMGKIFCLAAEKNNVDVIEILIENRYFYKIPSGKNGLGEAFVIAVSKRHFQIMNKIMDCDRFKEIPTEDHGLGEAFIIAAKNEDSEILQILINCNRFKDIPIGKNGLGEAFIIGAAKGNYPIIQKIIDCNRFQEIPRGENGIGEAFVNITKNGWITLTRMITDINRFKGIPRGKNGLGEAFAEAAKRGDIENVRTILKSSRYKDIPTGAGRCGLSEAFISAIQNNDYPIAYLIISCSRFEEIPLDGNYGLFDAFVKALKSKEGSKILEEIMGRDCFEKIALKGKDFCGWTALHHAAAKNKGEVVQALIDKKASVNQQNKKDCTPLMLARDRFHQDIVDILIKAKASDYQKSKESKPKYSISRNSVEIIRNWSNPW